MDQLANETKSTSTPPFELNLVMLVWLRLLAHRCLLYLIRNYSQSALFVTESY